MGGTTRLCPRHRTKRVWECVDGSESRRICHLDSDETSRNRRCSHETIVSNSNSCRIQNTKSEFCEDILRADDHSSLNESFTRQVRRRIRGIEYLARNGSRALLISCLLCAALPTSCSSGLKSSPRELTVRSRNLLCVPCPDVLGPSTSPYQHPKPHQAAPASLLARGLQDLQKCNAIDGIDGRRSSTQTDILLSKKNTYPRDASQSKAYGLRSETLAGRKGRVGSADWSMSEKEFQHRTEDIDDSPLDFFPVLKPSTDRGKSAKAAAAAVAAAAANMGQLKLSEKAVEVDPSVDMLECNFPALELECAWRCIPHPLKVARGGEDVHMICRAGGATLLGVFDGVGGWAELGVDPADYARRLVAGIEREFRRDPGMCDWQERPLLTMLTKAYEELKREDFPGSCTACLAMLNSLGQLHILNLGDSGMHVLRDGLSAFSTNEQQHYFNCPFQLGMGSDDTPAKADYFILDELAEDDVLVLATDGVWDNVYEEDMTRIVQDVAGRPASIARSLAEMSHAHGRDPCYASPFSTNAAARGLRYMGGKLDDVTVVVSRVRRAVSAGAVPLAAAGRCEEGAGGAVAGAETSPVSSMDSSSDGP